MAKNKKKGKEVIDEDFGDYVDMDNPLTQKNLIETERFINRLEIQNEIMKKIISPIQDTSTNKNSDK